MRVFLLAVIGISLAGCGGNGGGSNSGPVRSSNGPVAVTDPTPTMDVFDFRGATKIDSGVSSVIDSSGSITATSSGAGVKSIKLTLSAPADLSYEDILYPALVLTPNSSQVPVFTSLQVSLFEGATKHDAIPWYNSPMLRLQTIPRDQRDAVTAVEFTWTAPAGQSTLLIGGLYRLRVWLSLLSSYDPGSNPFPTFQTLSYQTTYFNSSTSFESPLSIQTDVAPSGQDHLGQYERLTTSTSPGFDKVRFYRIVTENNVTTRYRIGEVPNTGTPTVIDKYPLDVVKTFPTY